MIDKIKLLTMYLPQYHQIPENDEFWGEGFTDWTTVKSAKQYFKEVKQPKVPLNKNYYDLSKIENIQNQVELAKKYGIDGFVFYHYWFSSKKQLLQTPAELFLSDKSLNIEFCFDWDNEPWKRTWDAQEGNAWSPLMDEKIGPDGKKTLVEFDYEKEDGWKKHFNYLLPFFKDERYIKINNKPVFMYCNYYKPDELKAMAEYWQILAKNNGFEGIFFISKFTDKTKDIVCNYSYIYQPHYAAWERCWYPYRIIDRLKTKYLKVRGPFVYDYKKTWKRILRQCDIYKNEPVYYGAFVNYDDTPRRGEKGKLIIGKTKELFRYYMQQLINKSKEQNKEFIFVTAWNEWGEGAFLEPDEEEGFSYLDILRDLKR